MLNSCTTDACASSFTTIDSALGIFYLAAKPGDTTHQTASNWQTNASAAEDRTLPHQATALCHNIWQPPTAGSEICSVCPVSPRLLPQTRPTERSVQSGCTVTFAPPGFAVIDAPPNSATGHEQRDTGQFLRHIKSQCYAVRNENNTRRTHKHVWYHIP